MTNDSTTETTFSYTHNNFDPLNCPDHSNKLRSGLIGAKGFQPAPTLKELLERDKKRLNAAIKAEPLEATTLSNELTRKKIASELDAELKSAYQTAWRFERLTEEQGNLLLEKGDLLILGALANRTRQHWHPTNSVTYLVDRNINYTNVCRIFCDFCAFYRKETDSDAYVLKNEMIFKKIEEAITLGATGILIQGGVNPKLKIEYYETLFSEIKAKFKIHIHGLSIIEIENIAQVSKLSLEDTIQRLVASGLDSIPGAGAEILVDEIRLHQSPVKKHSHRWIDTMLLAHKLDLPTTATMMFGALETKAHIVSHMLKIREAQDTSSGFYAFIMWTFQGENTELLEKNPELTPTSGVTYLKVLAVSRLFMDNIPNIQGSWVTMGPKIGQTSLHFGANDMGSIMIEENVVSAAGTSFELTQQGMKQLIATSGFSPLQRDTYYNHINVEDTDKLDPTEKLNLK